LLIVLVGLTLETQAFFTSATLELRIWKCLSWSRHTDYSFFFLRLLISYQWFFVGLAVSSKPSSQTIWLKV